MVMLTIHNVPETWVDALRQRAVRHQRSRQGEPMAILRCAVAEIAAADPAKTVLQRPAQSPAGAPIRTAWKPVEQIAAELRARFPQGLPTGPSSMGMIRQRCDAP